MWFCVDMCVLCVTCSNGAVFGHNLQWCVLCLQKADRTALDGKASREWVDSTFERLDREIREAKSKLSGQEEAFKVAMSQINEDVDGKLDRNELEPLKDYFGMWLSGKYLPFEFCLAPAADKRLDRVKTAPTVVQKEISSDDAAGFRK